ncbi:hypothetical protein [Brachyspira aalborgi]|uniref:Uncharacterized protein n=1 Tax=Brachyspira aalborgi TaxID=29522 RepID=A0A5C8FZK3_9SPIR|nr:hypothetical protein [Brachyspira aalborgi]TXJ55173.1 hypothetical protein EPJ76_06155 [Brachyspira aalborgi]
MKNFINKLKPYRNYILSLALLIGLANYFFFDYFPRQRQNRENIVEEFVKRINQSLPNRIDEITTMTKVSYFPPDEIVFNYILEGDIYFILENKDIYFTAVKENTLNDIKNNSTLLKIYKSTGKNFKFRYFSAENSNETFLNEFIIYGKEF